MVTTTTKSLHVATLILPIAALVVLSLAQPTNALSYVGGPANLGRRGNVSPRLASRMVKHHNIKRQTGTASGAPSNTGRQQDPLESGLSSLFNGGGGGDKSTSSQPPNNTQPPPTSTPSSTSETSTTPPPTTDQNTNTVNNTPPPPSDTPSNTPSNTPTNTNTRTQPTKGTTTVTTPGPSSSSPPTDGPTGIPMSVTIALIVVGSSIAGIIVIWTVIRRWKFSPSRQFEDRLEPINWDPTTNQTTPAPGVGAARTPEMLDRAASNASHRVSAASFAAASSADHSIYAGAAFGPDEHMNRAPAMPPMLDYQSGPYAAGQDGYSDMQRGPSPPQGGYSRGPYDYDPAAPQQDAYGGYEQYPDYSGYAAGTNYPPNPNPYGDNYAVNPQQRY